MLILKGKLHFQPLNWNTICSSFPSWTWVLSHHQVEGYLSLENILLGSTQEEHGELSCPGPGKHSLQEDPIDVDDATLVENLWSLMKLKRTFLPTLKKHCQIQNGRS
ncbi:uncharacterized protein LOC115991440 [Quercus lobata]|uniref:uncharacterized protein LOC115991440 n=1 Tax=Quercus lobata TaxID=97700 RepID=UPI0012488197|nr:uncharacterized protein LOC115991440 [Quercus lobata]